MAKVLWKDIPGYEGSYQASTSGEIRSMERFREYNILRQDSIISRVDKIEEKVLKPYTHTTGYNYVNLGFGGKNRFSVHYLVALTFLGDVPEGMEVNHRDFNRSNNSLDNLEIVTSSENKHHNLKANRHNTQKIPSEDIISIRARRAQGERVCDLAREYGVDRHTITAITTNKTWRFI